MAVDQYFDQVSLLVQGGSTANVASGGILTMPAGVSAAADHLVFGAAASMLVSDPTKAVGVYYGFGNNEALDTTSMELVFEHAWAPHANLFRTQKLQVRGHQDTQNRYEVFVRGVPWDSPFTVKMAEFDLPAAGKVMLYVTTGGVDAFTIVPETGSPITVSNIGYLTFSYPVLLGATGEVLSISPPSNAASVSNTVNVQGSSGVSTPSILQIFGPSYLGRPSGQAPVSGSATMTVAGITTSIANIAGFTSAAIASTLAAQAVQLINAGSMWNASAQAGGSGSTEIRLTPRTANVSGGTSVSIVGSASFDAAPGYASGVVSLSSNASLLQYPAYSPPPAVVQSQSAYVSVADPTRPFTLNLVLDGTERFPAQNNVQGAVDSIVASLLAKSSIASAAATQLSATQWHIQFVFANPGAVSGVGVTITEEVSSQSAITKLYGARVTAPLERSSTTFPTLPWPTTSIPSSGGGGGLVLPSDVIFAVSADLGNVNDQAQYSLAQATSGTITVPTSGSRTNDGYIRNTDNNQMADASVSYSIVPAFNAALATPQSATFEFDIFVEPAAFLGGQIMGLIGGVASNYVALTSGPLGLAIAGSLLAGSGAGYGGFAPNAWTHVAHVADYNGGDRIHRTYINGQLVENQSIGATPFAFEAGSFVRLVLMQYDAQFIGNGALAGGLDNIILTTRAKYNANFTPATSFQELTGGVGGPGTTVINAAGYNDLDGATGTGTFNTQATYPTAYFSANATLDDALSSGDSFAVDGNTINFTSSLTLAAATSTGTFVRGTPVTFDGAATTDDALSGASFYAGLPLEWSGDSALEDASQLALYLFLAPAEFSGDAVLDGVTPGLASFNLIDPVVWRVNAEVPAATLVANATQFLVNAQVPAATLRASMSEYRGFELDAQVPAASLSAWAGVGVSGQVPMATLSASGTVVNTLRLDADLPRVTLAADASLGQLLSMSATVPAPTLSAWAGAGVRGAAPAATGAANVISGGAFRVDATIPAATATIGATSMNVLRLVGDVPAVTRANWLAISRQVPAIGMLAHIAPVSAVTRVAYSFTLANGAMTRYPAYPFIQVIRMGNTFYGVAEDGLHEIGGTTDNAAPIPWAWETCLSDFGQAERKTVVSAYLGGYVPEAMTYTIRAGDVPTGTNAHATTATAVLRNHRQKFGIGRKSRYFAFGLSAAQGRVAIESIEFEVAPMSRRI